MQEVREIWQTTGVQGFEGQGGKYVPFDRESMELFEKWAMSPHIGCHLALLVCILVLNKLLFCYISFMVILPVILQVGKISVDRCFRVPPN